MTSDLETTFAFQIQTVGLPPPVREYRFAPPRRWRFDFAWPEQRLACEVEGATWIHGRHTRGSGFQKDCEKYNSAALAGWKVLRFTGAMIHSGEALAIVERALQTGLPSCQGVSLGPAKINGHREAQRTT